MFRIWGRLIKDNKTTGDYTVCIDDCAMTRTAKVYKALDEICMHFDLAKPIWLTANKNDFIRHAKTRFTKDSFVEHIEFDYLEFQVIEEEY